MNITTMGDGLNILITSSYALHQSWMAFASWYSIYKNMPDSEVSVLCARDLQGVFAYNWIYRSGLRFFQHENVGKQFNYPELNKLYATFTAIKENIVQQPLMVIDADVMCVRPMSKGLVERLNSDLAFGVSGPVWFFNGPTPQNFMDALNNLRTKRLVLPMLEEVVGKPEFIDELCCDCRDQTVTTFASYKESCGKFSASTWQEEQTMPPFGYGKKYLMGIEMSTNERRILNMWDQMYTVYEAMK